LNLDPERVFFCDHYRYLTGQFNTDFIADIYRSSDVLLAASRSEGFGLPILEAQACGTPVITTDFTSMPELTWYGLTVQPAQLAYSPLSSWHAVPSIAGIYDALSRIYNWKAADHAAGRSKAQQRIAAEYTWDRIIYNNWAGLLESLQAELAGEAPPKLTWPDRETWDKQTLQEPGPAQAPILQDTAIKPTWGHLASHFHGVDPAASIPGAPGPAEPHAGAAQPPQEAPPP
jgi:hypothetical protein